MSLNTSYKGADTLKMGSTRPLRAVRESEPSFMVDDIINDVSRIKEEHQVRRMKKQRQARLSQIESPLNLLSSSPSLLAAEDLTSPHQYFFSPPCGHQQRVIKKSPTTALLHSEFVSPRNFTKKANPSDLKSRKSPGKNNHRESLNIIEEMLMSHGINIHSKNKETVQQPIKKAPRSPRYSQPLMQNKEFHFLKKRKENQSYGNKKEGETKEGEGCQSIKEKDLKETMSTSSSYKNLKPFKISDFELGRELGKGKFGRVKLARHKKTGMICSLKIISKDVIRQENLVDQVIKEIKIQSFLNHSHIIKLYSVFSDRQNVYLLLELCSEGNLYQHMQKKLRIPQQEASVLIKSVCEAVSELHHYRIIHRDIKPENIVLCYGMAKICDFGWSTQIRDSMRDTFCGTPLYVSPQLLSGQLYDEKVDLWAIGIMGFEMMTGSIPFSIKSEADLVKIIESKIVFPKWMLKETTSFLQELLEKDPRNRKDIEQLLDHPFMSLHQKK